MCGTQHLNLAEQDATANPETPYGVLVCDECDAIRLEINLTTANHEPDLANAKCPVCHDALWGMNILENWSLHRFNDRHPPHALSPRFPCKSLHHPVSDP